MRGRPDRHASRGRTPGHVQVVPQPGPRRSRRRSVASCSA